MELTLPAFRLAHWEVARHAFTVEADAIRLTVGHSSAEVALETKITVTN